ncbi:uncharacterized protein si:dkey-61p9.7 isoform X2 [Danio aesculapii]|uniref:uncharacterized protein si:dkey-61p9.7 isoform X2 n=1 Tax=Danio aesculapii TaxID=1142201 RepID=UPI0024C065CD|nr:uncharacterized protein si:dkey-61p9.7 isoform X2 [Danio aesculapii]
MDTIMSQENLIRSAMCLHCEHDQFLREQRVMDLVKERELKIAGLQRQYQEQSVEQQNYDQRDEQLFKEQKLKERFCKERKWLEQFTPCLQCCEAKQEGRNAMDCQSCTFTQQKSKQASDCEVCPSLQEMINNRESTIEDLKKACADIRKRAEQSESKLADFKERMTIEASAEIGSSSRIFEDINNPCRDSELRKSYELLRVEGWPRCLMKIKDGVKKGKLDDEKTEKETIKRMMKNVFDKALADMKKKRESLQAVFRITDGAKSFNKKQHCMDMALQNLQAMILYGEFTYYQDINEELGLSNPDYLCKFADLCYKQGCLMALHNPPLTLDWDNKERHGHFPLLKIG